MNPPAGAAAFLDGLGWGEADVLPLAGDASFRRYFRVADHGRSAILMDSPPDKEDPKPFLDVAAWLTERGFPAPAILGTDLTQGLVLLEDFGDARMRETVEAAPESLLRLYEAAIDILIRLRDEPAGPWKVYDRRELHREADLLVEWYCPAVGLTVDADGYRVAWDAVFAHALTPEPVTVLRDYHVENLMLIGGTEAIGLLDFQDAAAGHPAYDLVSLLQDARRDVEPAIEAAMLDRYRRITGVGDEFDAAYHVLGAQRNAKIVGIFTRLWQRDGKPQYLAHIPRVWRLLEADLRHPALARIGCWLDRFLPPDIRCRPDLRSKA